MTKSDQQSPVSEDIDIQTLGRALWRAKGWIFGLTIGAGIVTFIGLSMVRPLYTSEARILVQDDESSYTRPAEDEGRNPQPRVLDEQAVQSQVQVLTSRDLAVEVIKALDLTNNPVFAKDGDATAIARFLRSLGLGIGSEKSEEEKAANTFAENLSVYQLAKSSVISLDYTSGESSLAAKIANKLADVYIDWQRGAKLEQTKDATAWLSAQIDVLRKKVAEAEAAAEQFRASQGLFAGTNNVTLNAQQLSELNSQLILAKALKSEAEARARLIEKLLTDNGDIDAMPEVLKSELIARLIEQRVQVQRQLAELSATLLPSHPRIKQLTSELADVRAQIRDEATKVVKGLENEADVASARETSLRNSLNEVKTQASGLSEAEIKLRALEREAKAQRDLLESYLARYRDASARHDMGAVPAQATVVSQAHASILPSFPKRGPISLLVAAATALLALAYVLARELIGAPSVTRDRLPASEPRARPRRPAPAPAVAAATMPVPSPEPVLEASELEPAASDVAQAEQADLPLAASARASAGAASKPDHRKAPSFLPARRRSHVSEHPASPEQQAAPGAPASKDASPAPSEQSAAGLLARLRRGLSQSQSEPETPAPQPSGGWLARIRGTAQMDQANGAASDVPAAAPIGETMPVLRTNDLRHYLNQRLASARSEAANDSGRKGAAVATKAGNDKVGPVLKSLDAVLNRILASGNGAPRALLVAGASPKVDATREAIAIARAFVAGCEQVVLIDLTRGPAAISGPLGLPRSPGLNDLVASRASFEDVVRVDADTPLQVIAAGNPRLAAAGDKNERFGHIFEALTQTYDSVVLHADTAAVRKFTPALKFELPVVVAVLPAGASARGDKTDLAEFSALGCPILVYEQSGKEPQSRLLDRVAAI